jgi:hypothetical protein
VLVTLDAVALRAVEEAVQDVVGHDQERLAAMAAEFDDLYLWTRVYGAHGVADLVLPPGSPAEWEIDWLETQPCGGVWRPSASSIVRCCCC